MKVLMPQRILDRNVGGNTTYARELEAGLHEQGVDTGRIASGRNAISTLLLESQAALRSHGKGTVLHFVADTGQIFDGKQPSVVTVHGVASRWISTARTRFQESVWRSRVGRAISSSDAVITVSQSSADDVASVFNIDRSLIHVIPHGIDLSKFTGEPRPSGEVEARLPNEYLLYLGNIEPRKNLIPLIDAVERIDSLPPLVIAGKPAWNYEASMRRIEDSQKTIYLGFVSDADRLALMSGCTAFVFPSLYEGFGFPVLEAMAAGARVITTNSGSLRDVAGPAWRLDSTDTGAIGEGLVSALGSGEWMSRTRDDGADWVRQFSWKTSVDRHIGVYKGALRQ